MKLAVLSDIHGNRAALEAVLADIAVRGGDAIVNLGDSLSGPLEPGATADRLMALSIPAIAGNHERQLLTQTPGEMGASDRHADGELTAAHRAWIAAQPPSLWLTDEIYLCHGTPQSDLDYFLETVTAQENRAASAAEVAARLGAISAALTLCGHSHTPRQMRLDDGRLVVNPGSVGLPAYDWDRPCYHKMETGTPEARYAIVEKTSSGWQAQFIAVAYDFESAASRAEAHGRPDWALALRTGRC